MRCLVVVDMQSSFKPSCQSWLINNIISKIREYKKNKDFVIIVEYGPIEGGLYHTLPDIINEVKDYPISIVVEKYDDDASEYILDKVALTGMELIEVCGVNLDACVLSTSLGLSYSLPKNHISIVLECCDAEEGYEQALTTCEKHVNPTPNMSLSTEQIQIGACC